MNIARRSKNERTGFIGLGIMGRPMARNLLSAGYGLTVWNRSRPGIDALIEAGAESAASAQAVAEQSDVVLTHVGDSPDVEQLWAGVAAGGVPVLGHRDRQPRALAVPR